MGIGGSKHTVRQANILSEASYAMKLIEKRLLMLSICQIDPNIDYPKHEPIFVVVTSEGWMEAFPETSNARRDMKQAAKSISSRRIMFSLEDNQVEEICPWFLKARIIPHEGKVEVEFNHHITPYLTNLKEQFFTYRIMDMHRIRSKNAIRLYEVLVRLHKSNETDITVSNLKKYLGIPNSYKLWNDFNRFVLIICVEEINRVSHLKVEYKVIKRLRKTEIIRFHIETDDGAGNDRDGT